MLKSKTLSSCWLQIFSMLEQLPEFTPIEPYTSNVRYNVSHRADVMHQVQVSPSLLLFTVDNTTLA